MRKAFIGISGSWTADESGPFVNSKKSYVNDDFVRSVVEAGGVPIILPFIGDFDEDLLNAYFNKLDGLILTGGHDVDPGTYGKDPLPKLNETWKERDNFDIILIEKALEKKIPIFGICRGMQMLNVYFKGTLFQDLSYRKEESIMHVQKNEYNIPIHWVYFKEGNTFSEILGKQFFANSWHHQAVDKLGEGLTVCGTSSDGIIEAFENSDKKIWGAQWHPEMMSRESSEMRRLFKCFAEKCI